MNERNIVDWTNMCRVCFQSNCHVSLVTAKEVVLLQTFIGQKPYMDDQIRMCIYCRYLLKKLFNFSVQCQKSDDILKCHEQKHLQPVPSCYSLSITEPNIIFYDSFEKQDDCKSESSFICEDNDLYHEDDIPLSMFSKYEPKMAETSEIMAKEMTEQIKEESFYNEEAGAIEKDSQKKGRKKGNKLRNKKNVKQLRPGFSSRMVQETNEYLVIKLSKEQVLREMDQKSRCEAYLRAPFKCENCVRGFNFEDVLRNHMEKHCKEHGSLKCDICHQYCPSTVSLRGHMKSHTTRYKCKVCGEIRLSRQHLLEHHAVKHSPHSVTYTCEHCGFLTARRTVIQRHIKTHGPSRRHTCERCGQLFKSMETLRVHTKRHDESSLFQCGHCQRKFIYKSLLQSHIQRSHINNEYYCVECDVRFKSRDSLKLHFQRAKKHRDASSFKHECPHCEQRFITKSTLSSHLAGSHGGAREHSCGECSRAYSSRDALRAHAARAHRTSERKESTCTLCQRVFSQKTTLTRHMRVHTGERPYACGECSHRFAQSSTRDRHVALVHRKLPRHTKKQDLQPSQILLTVEEG